MNKIPFIFFVIFIVIIKVFIIFIVFFLILNDKLFIRNLLWVRFIRNSLIFRLFMRFLLILMFFWLNPWFFIIFLIPPCIISIVVRVIFLRTYLIGTRFSWVSLFLLFFLWFLRELLFLRRWRRISWCFPNFLLRILLLYFESLEIAKDSLVSLLIKHISS